MTLTGPLGSRMRTGLSQSECHPNGDPYHPFEMTYTEIGARYIGFKYWNDVTVVEDLLETVEDFLSKRRVRPGNRVCHPSAAFDDRSSQPCRSFGQGLAKRLGVSIYVDRCVKLRKLRPMKNVDDWYERQRILGKAIQIGKDDVTGKSILLLDDLIQSGATLRRAAEVLLNDGRRRPSTLLS